METVSSSYKILLFCLLTGTVTSRNVQVYRVSHTVPPGHKIKTFLGRVQPLHILHGSHSSYFDIRNNSLVTTKPIRYLLGQLLDLKLSRNISSESIHVRLHIHVKDVTLDMGEVANSIHRLQNIFFGKRHLSKEPRQSHPRYRRDVREERVFVVNRNIPTGSDLFTVTSVPPDPAERFLFSEPRTDDLTLDLNTGMVSRGSAHTWNETVEMESFTVNITRSDDAEYLDILPVDMYFVDRGHFDVIMSNVPEILWETIPEWIRPDTTIFTMHAIDSIPKDGFPGAPVKYVLESVLEFDESGDYVIDGVTDELFYVDEETGEVKIAARQQWPINHVYELAISAQCVGAASLDATPAQVLSVQVGVRDPQFYQDDRYVLEISESSGTGSVGSIKAKSFQGLGLAYTMSPISPTEAGIFSLDRNTGALSLNSELSYNTDPHQYRFTLTVAEQSPSPHSSETMLIINLLGENLHTPFFGPAVYITRELREDASQGTTVFTVTGIDLDWGINGEMDFHVNDPTFRVSPVGNEGKQAEIQVNQALDYDFLPEFMYNFEIEAVDRGTPSKSSTVFGHVYLTNVNDNPPKFLPERESIRVLEGATSGLLIHVAQAFDPDGDTFRFAFNTGENGGSGACNSGTNSETDCGIFRLDRDTGHITLTSDIRRGQLDITLAIDATDNNDCCPGTGGSPQTSTGYVTVGFIGVNNPPRFPECSHIDASVDEGQEPGVEVTTVTAVDEDTGVNGELDFTLQYRIGAFEPFAVNASGPDGKTAVITTIVTLNREDPRGQYVIIDGQVNLMVTLQATDRGPRSLTTNCFFFVTIGDINDNNPVFDNDWNPIPAYMLRSTPSNERVIRVYATDLDYGENARVSYSMEEDSSCSGCFAMDPASGWITRTDTGLSGVSSVQLTVSATDAGTPPLSNVDVTKVKINILSDQAAMPPSWEPNNIDDTPVTINENVPINYIVGRYSATAQPGEQITYHIITENSPFRITADDQGFNLTVSGILDYTRQSQHVVKMRASVRRGRDMPNKDVRLTVNLNDRNVNAPRFMGLDSGGAYPAAVSPETESGLEIVRVDAHDDDGTSPNNQVTYSFHVSCESACDEFDIDSSTGVITANTAFPGQGEEQLFLMVRAVDGADSDIPGVTGRNTDLATVVVQVIGPSDNPPYFEANEYAARVDEGSPYQTNVTVISAFDPDPILNLPQYSIISGNDNKTFAVDLLTGRIYITGGLKYYGEPVNMRYRVFDGNQENVADVVVTIDPQNLLDPVFDVWTFTSDRDIIEEDDSINPGNPSVITTVSASDIERGTDITYFLEGGIITNYPDTFRVTSTGEVSLIRAISRDFPDGHDNWQFNVVARDNPIGLPARHGYCVINVLLEDINDNAPWFDIRTIEGDVSESSPAGATVMELVAIDVDMGNNARVTYAAAEPSDIPQLGGSDLFTVSSAGIVTTTAAASGLVWPDHTRFSFTVVAKDNPDIGSALETSQTVDVVVRDINNTVPSFVGTDPIQISIPEMIPIGGSVTVITSSDADYRENAQRIYRVVGGADQSSFYMDSIYTGGTGVLRIQEIVDYDDMNDPSMSLQVTVQNPGGQPVQRNVQITVTDVNDNAPVFAPPTYDATIDEPGTIGTSVVTVTATDRDSGINAEFEYTIDYGNTDPSERFQVDSTSGEITLRNELDRETVSIHIIHVLATDKGEPPQTGTATVSVTVGDLNDNAPNFVPPTPRPIVQANAASGSEVVRFNVYDPDTDVNGPPFTLEYICNDPACQDFSLTTENDGRVGVLRAQRSDGYSREVLGFSFYNLVIRMTDNPTSGQPSQTADRRLTVQVESGNYFPPEDGRKYVTVYNYRRLFDSFNIGRVYVGGEDDWNSDRSHKTFTLITNNDNFQVEENDGTIIMRKTAGRGLHVLEVQVVDSHFGTTTVSTVEVFVVHIEEKTIEASTSIRIRDVTPEELLEQQEEYRGPIVPSLLERFRLILLEKLSITKNVVEEDILIYGIVEVEERVVDITVSVRLDSRDYIRPSYLSGILITDKNDFEDALGKTIILTPVNLCQPDYSYCWDSGCTTYARTTDTPLLIDANSVSMVGINVTYEPECVCGDRTFPEGSVGERCTELSCLNGGTCVDEEWGNSFSCVCPETFEGDRCQQTKVSFLGGTSWAYYETLEQCEDGKLSLEFATFQASALLLYNGPIDDGDGDLRDYIAIELNSGMVRVRVNMGDGEEVLSVTSPSQLNDGYWHSVEVFKTGREFRVVVDHCKDSDVTEDLETSASDRSMCEAVGTPPGERTLMRITTPLQLGGRSLVTSYPDNLHGSLEGCVKDLWNNGRLYDLRTEFGGSSDAEDGCVNEACTACPVNSTCIGSLVDSNPICKCKPGFRGPNCDIEVTVKSFGDTPSFIEWTFRDTINTTVDSKSANFQILFRTRQENGVIFSASSFSTLEQFILEVRESRLFFYYDLGSGNRYLSLDYVEVNDGQWHLVRIVRHNNRAIMQLDSGEGRFYNETFVENGHRLIYLGRLAHGSAYIKYQLYTNDPVASNDLIQSCLVDPRYGDIWIPMDSQEEGEGPTSLATVTDSNNMFDGCDSNIICGNINCPDGQYCINTWHSYLCWCDDPMYRPNPDGVCTGMYDCSVDPCIYGDCLPLTDQVVCDCDEGYEGEYCGNAIVIIPAAAGMGTGWIVGITFLILLLLLLLLLLLFLCWKRFRDKPIYIGDPDDDKREFVMVYEEEGAGEEDMHAYDLSSLKVAINVDKQSETVMKENQAMMVETMARREASPAGPLPDELRAPKSFKLPPPIIEGDGNDNVGAYIIQNLEEANRNHLFLPFDSVREYMYEGGEMRSVAGSLSSIMTTSSGNLDFSGLETYGQRFTRLADMYLGGESDEDEDADYINVQRRGAAASASTGHGLSATGVTRTETSGQVSKQGYGEYRSSSRSMTKYSEAGTGTYRKASMGTGSVAVGRPPATESPYTSSDIRMAHKSTSGLGQAQDGGRQFELAADGRQEQIGGNTGKAWLAVESSSNSRDVDTRAGDLNIDIRLDQQLSFSGTVRQSHLERSASFGLIPAKVEPPVVNGMYRAEFRRSMSVGNVQTADADTDDDPSFGFAASSADTTIQRAGYMSQHQSGTFKASHQDDTQTYHPKPAFPDFSHIKPPDSPTSSVGTSMIDHYQPGRTVSRDDVTAGPRDLAAGWTVDRSSTGSQGLVSLEGASNSVSYSNTGMEHRSSVTTRTVTRTSQQFSSQRIEGATTASWTSEGFNIVDYDAEEEFC